MRRTIFIKHIKVIFIKYKKWIIYIETIRGSLQQTQELSFLALFYKQKSEGTGTAKEKSGTRCGEKGRGVVEIRIYDNDDEVP